jgi:hypothetical protein
MRKPSKKAATTVKKPSATPVQRAAIITPTAYYKIKSLAKEASLPSRALIDFMRNGRDAVSK